jgi:hypothetical protein
VVAELAVDVAIFSVANVLRPDAFLAGFAGGAFLMVGFPFGDNFFIVKDFSLASRARVLVLIRSHDSGGIEIF